MPKNPINDSITVTPSELLEILYYYIKNKQPVLIKGAPGIGKTDIVKQIGKKLNANVLISHPVVSDPTDYKGMPAIVNDRAEFLPFGDLRALIEADKLTIAFLDDVGQAPAVVQASLMHLLLSRAINGKAISDHVTFIAATNRKQDKAGVSGILEPVKSRFATILELEPDLTDWCCWAIKNKMPFQLIAFIRFKPSFLMDFKPSMDITNSSCPRTIANVGYAMNGGLPESCYYPSFCGSAGQGFATEFIAFLKLMNNLPDIDEAIANPEKAVIPAIDKIDILHAYSSALAQRTTEKNIDKVMKLIFKIPPEFAILPIKNILERKRDLFDNKMVIDWIDRNSGIAL